MKKTKLTVLGLGTMGEAIVEGLLMQGAWDIRGSTRSKASAEDVKKRLKIDCSTENKTAARGAEILLLAVKPHQAKDVVAEVAPTLRNNQILISICASITLSQLRAWTKGKCHVVRAMPNTPALVGEAMTVLAMDADFPAADRANVEKLFSSVGKTAFVEESLMDGVTGLSGCGPAYIYLVIEALSEAGVKVGLPRKTATLLAAQTLMGASKMVLERGEHPAALKDEVTTPAGCTIDGLMALEEGKLRVTLIKAVLAAAKRSEKLKGV